MSAGDTGSSLQGQDFGGRRSGTVRRDRGRSSRVRPYTITGGRTRFRQVLLVETLVSALNLPADRADRSLPELAAIHELCRGQMRSIAEISAVLRIPLGVVKVLVSDLADQGGIRVHGTPAAEVQDGTVGATASKRDLLEKVLGGLRKL
ncbi:hypothetical protein KNE206_05330 [Kitasatospora sp. NE20-6]